MEELIQNHAGKSIIHLYQRLWMWIRSIEGKIVWLSVGGHSVLHVLLLLFMPLAYYSELNGHDGDSYYALAQTPLPLHPAYTLMRYKRIFFPLFAKLTWPWDPHIGFAIAGIVGAALANLYFYRIASLYTPKPLRVTLVFAFSPYLFAATHIALPDPLSVAMVLAAFYYLLKNQFVEMTICSALALLFKEVAAVSILALAILTYRRMGLKRAALYLILVGLPTLVVVITYAHAWNDWLWYLKESRTTLVPAPVTLIKLLLNPGSTLIVRFDSLINMGVLTLLGYSLWRLRHDNRMILIFVILSIIPLLFLDERQYASDFDMVRQYMVAAPALLVFTAGINRLRRSVFYMLLCGMSAYAMYYILSTATFFVHYKQAILNLLPFK